jgi:Zn ribbon nucleic-acid-binding protein
MSQAKKGRLNYRCPQCFERDIDMDLFYDEDKKEYYCLRCCFRGSEEDVLKMNEEAKHKYHLINKRVDSFNDDDKPIISHTISKGEK